jgi:hypothetical protein
MKEQKENTVVSLNKLEKAVRVQKIPMSTGRSKFKSKKKFDSTLSPFEYFSVSNGKRSRGFSF